MATIARDVVPVEAPGHAALVGRGRTLPGLAAITNLYYLAYLTLLASGG